MAKKSTALAPTWKERLADIAKRQSQVEKPRAGGVRGISTRGGVFSIDDEEIGTELACVVVAAAHENQYFDKPFNPKTPTSPVCYAFSDNEAEDPEAVMAPNPEWVAEQQNEQCEGCWANQMGSANVGRGKACKNIRRLMVILPTAFDSLEDMADAPLRMVKVPVMSVRNWSKHVHTVNETMNLPFYGVQTTLRLIADADSQFVIKFQLDGALEVDDTMFAALETKIAEAERDIVSPYPTAQEIDERNAKPARQQKQKNGKAPRQMIPIRQQKAAPTPVNKARANLAQVAGVPKRRVVGPQ